MAGTGSVRGRRTTWRGFANALVEQLPEPQPSGGARADITHHVHHCKGGIFAHIASSARLLRLGRLDAPLEVFGRLLPGHGLLRHGRLQPLLEIVTSAKQTADHLAQEAVHKGRVLAGDACELALRQRLAVDVRRQRRVAHVADDVSVVHDDLSTRFLTRRACVRCHHPVGRDGGLGAGEQHAECLPSANPTAHIMKRCHHCFRRARRHVWLAAGLLLGRRLDAALEVLGGLDPRLRLVGHRRIEPLFDLVRAPEEPPRHLP